jgi:hypothetical protein
MLADLLDSRNLAGMTRDWHYTASPVLSGQPARSRPLASGDAHGLAIGAVCAHGAPQRCVAALDEDTVASDGRIDSYMVVDASVMAAVPRVVPNLTVMMIAERVADEFLMDATEDAA